MKKRLISLLLALTMMMSLAACGGKNEEKEPAEEPEDQVEEPVPDTEMPEGESEIEASEGTEPEESEAENLPANPNEKPEVDNKPADSTEKPVSIPVQKPTENVPAEKPAEKPAEGQSKPAASVDLTAFYESVLSASEWPMMGTMEGETLDAFYPGLSAVATNQSVVAMAMMGSVVAEIALVEVQNAADAETVKAIFQARIDYQVGDETNPGGAWYPESIEGWKNNSRIVSNGNCVMMVAYEGADNVVASFNALFA